MDPTKRRIRKIDRDVQRFVAHALHNTSLSLSDYEMIQTVHHRPGITQGELCRRYSQDKSTVARRAAKLEREGYIQRLPSEEDRRSKHLYVTEKGLSLRNQKIDAETFYFSWLTAELTEEELAVLVPLLDKLHTRSRNERLEDLTHILAEYRRWQSQQRLLLGPQWKDSPYRKPLILKGVRQVGKTWLLKEFGKRYYENTAYFNFDENEEYKQFFETTKDVNRILQNLMLASGQKILPEKTLIIFDEVQDCPKVINSMKYFCENAPQYHIACAGSLLGITLAKPSSFPVGKVNFMQIDPMTFTEFLLANGDENLANYLETVNTIEPIPDAFFNPLYEKLKMYYVTGGMPESVKMWTEARDVDAMQEALSGIIGAYERDFAKHPNISEFPKISMIWKSIPSQLARENKKFIYKVVKEGARTREYEDALQWLVDARLVHKIYRSTAPGLPVAAYDDLSAFKIYLVDVGLLRRLAQLAPTAFGEGNRLFTEFKGALTENFVLQTLITQFEVTPRYWTQTNPPYEVDFLIQRENDIFPVEVKSEANTTSRSLKKFKELFPDQVKLRVRFSLDNLKLDDDVLNIPLFMADQTDRLIGLAMEKRLR